MTALSGKALIGGLAALWFLCGGAAIAPADQTDARLPGLFDRLKAAGDVEAAQAIEAQIWAIWLEAGDPKIDALMSEGNEAIEADPALVNSDPEGAGWFFRLTIADTAELNGLLDGAAYAALLADIG